MHAHLPWIHQLTSQRASAAGSTSAAALAPPRIVYFRVDGITCHSCEALINGHMDAQSNVRFHSHTNFGSLSFLFLDLEPLDDSRRRRLFRLFVDFCVMVKHSILISGLWIVFMRDRCFCRQ